MVDSRTRPLVPSARSGSRSAMPHLAPWALYDVEFQPLNCVAIDTSCDELDSGGDGAPHALPGSARDDRGARAITDGQEDDARLCVVIEPGWKRIAIARRHAELPDDRWQQGACFDVREVERVQHVFDSHRLRTGAGVGYPDHTRICAASRPYRSSAHEYACRDTHPFYQRYVFHVHHSVAMLSSVTTGSFRVRRRIDTRCSQSGPPRQDPGWTRDAA